MRIRKTYCYMSLATLHAIWGIFFSIICISFTACSDKKISGKIDQGTIVFDIAYINNSGKSFPLHLLPKTMEMKFNQNFVSYIIEDRVGLFSIRNITNLKKQSHLTLIKVFDKKYVFNGNSKEPPVFFKDNKPYVVTVLKDTLRLAGMPCNKALVADITNSKAFAVFYTSNIDVPNPNNNTPYEKVNGVLLTFEIQMKSLEMKLTAKKVTKKSINDQDFLLPEGYKLISRSQMEEIINTLLP
jgi:hypothetical protein